MLFILGIQAILGQPCALCLFGGDPFGVIFGHRLVPFVRAGRCVPVTRPEKSVQPFCIGPTGPPLIISPQS